MKMRKTVVISSLVLMTIGAFAQQRVEKGILTFQSEKVQMGKLEQGKPATRIFTFTNTGKTPLQILAVNPSCGCTAAEYTKVPVLPGKTGMVKAVYNAAAPGPFSKTIGVQSNGETAMKVLTISGEVITKSQ